MRYILLIAILLFGVTGFAQDKTATIDKDKSYVDLAFTAADTINESETYYIEITSYIQNPSMQDVYLAGSAVSGSGDVVITVYGKKFSGDSYSSVGTSTWNSTLALDEVITVSTANRYRYFKVEFVADATDKQVLLTDVQFKQWYTGGNLSTSALSLSGALSVGTTSTFTGESTFNNHINLGAGDDLVGSSTSDIDMNSNFTVAGATGNTVIAGKLTQSTTEDGGASTQNSVKLTLAAGETFTGTTGNTFKVYDADNTVVHSGGEHTAVYANMKILSAMASGGKSVIYSGHNYGSGGDYQVIDAGVWLYGNLVDAFKVSGGSIVTGLDLSETTITGQELLGSNSESLDNLTDGVWNAGAGAVQASLYNFADATAVAGTADAITIDFTADLTVATGTMITFIAESAVTGAATLDVDGAGALAINEYNGAQGALDADDIRSGQVVTVVYNGTLWIMTSPSGN